MAETATLSGSGAAPAAAAPAAAPAAAHCKPPVLKCLPLGTVQTVQLYLVILNVLRLFSCDLIYYCSLKGLRVGRFGRLGFSLARPTQFLEPMRCLDCLDVGRNGTYRGHVRRLGMERAVQKNV